MPTPHLALSLALACAVLHAPAPPAAAAERAAEPEEFLTILAGEPAAARRALKKVAKRWHPGSAVMLVELLPFVRDAELRGLLIETLEKQTGQRLGGEVESWYGWIWDRPYDPHPQYASFKSLLYRNLDPRFAPYFDDARPAEIRLDEVRWGGVEQNGIPPLRSPRMIAATEADYLADDHIVFGLEIEGDARAYPKRILAWHEMFTDRVGGLEIAGVYCTLCGTVVVYETEHEGVEHRLGTSGFLYRSNKLMFDRDTSSLWSTLWGKPVIGPLVEGGIVLRRRGVVTTTWGEWRRRHPQTTVLSLATGYRRDYSEGAAYRDYFATDELMFGVPELDRRLANKDEVLTLLVAEHADEPLAIAADFLAAHPLYEDRIGEIDLVVLTDRSGANRVYRAGGVDFVSFDGDRTLVDAAGGRWTQSERALTAEDGRTLARLPAQRAFWFGWRAAFPDTRLVAGDDG